MRRRMMVPDIWASSSFFVVRRLFAWSLHRMPIVYSWDYLILLQSGLSLLIAC
jgi:hypothetical protein